MGGQEEFMRVSVPVLARNKSADCGHNSHTGLSACVYRFPQAVTSRTVRRPTQRGFPYSIASLAPACFDHGSPQTAWLAAVADIQEGGGNTFSGYVGNDDLNGVRVDGDIVVVIAAYAPRWLYHTGHLESGMTEFAPGRNKR